VPLDGSPNRRAGEPVQRRLWFLRFGVSRVCGGSHLRLLFAAEGGSLEVVKYLVETGSDPNGEPGEEPRSSPLICATCFDEQLRGERGGPWMPSRPSPEDRRLPGYTVDADLTDCDGQARVSCFAMMA
jgi:hypothetical protein